MNSRRRANPAPAWTPVNQLPELARALLSDDLGGRDAVPTHVADRVTALAAQWAAHGFTAGTVGPWVDLDPDCAAYLVGRSVPPRALDELIHVDGSAGPVTVRTALSTGRLTAVQAYEALAAAGGTRAPRTPVGQVGQADNPPEANGTAPARVAPAPLVFSHAEADRPEDDGRGEPRRTSRPSRTPFHR